MNILHVSAVKNWGGGEHHIENLCESLKNSNPEVFNLIFCAQNGDFHNRLKKTSLNYTVAKLSLKIDIRFSIKLAKSCKKNNIDLIHIHDPVALQLAIIADNFFKLPPFVFSKKTSFPIKNRKKTLYKYNYPKIKKILCVSDETRKITAKSIVETDKLVTVYHGTNLKTKSNITPFLLRDKYDLKNDTIIIGNIANHIRAKHLDTWVNIIDEIVNKQNTTNLFFVQIGSFTDRTAALQNRIKQLNLASYVAFLGYIPSASNFIPQFDVSLMTSQSEGLPQFIYESMYHKTPIVSTNVGGISEVIKHGINGFLAPIHDYKSLTKIVLKLAKNKNLQKDFTENAYETLITQYTTSNMAKKTLDIYKTILL
jgi:glycosyltransferase involved in cell wall biosynthesis